MTRDIHYNKKNVYLFTLINFGKYREHPMTVKQIIDSGKEGFGWVKWLMDNSWNFSPTQEVIDYIAEKEIEYGCILQQERSQ